MFDKPNKQPVWNVFIVPVTIIIVALIFSIGIFGSYVAEVGMMTKNIETAINKGIDPIAVRCSYADPDDRVCLAYAITHKTIDAPDAPSASTLKR